MSNICGEIVVTARPSSARPQAAKIAQIIKRSVVAVVRDKAEVADGAIIYRLTFSGHTCKNFREHTVSALQAHVDTPHARIDALDVTETDRITGEKIRHWTLHNGEIVACEFRKK